MNKSNKVVVWICSIIAVIALIVGIVLLKIGLDSSEDMFYIGIILLVIAVMFGICAFAVASSGKSQRILNDNVNAFIQQNNIPNAVFLYGLYSKKGDAGKAAAKTAASVAGAALSAAVFGIGFYKINSAGTPIGYIIGDNGLYIFNMSEPLVNGNVIFIEKGKFHKSEIEAKMVKVVMTDLSTNEIFTINSNKENSPEKISERLRALVNAEKPVTETPENTVPFEEFDKTSETDAENTDGQSKTEE